MLGTYASSRLSSSLETEQADLVQWASEIQNSLHSWVDQTSLLHNYANDTSSFSDAASSALYAASVYQLVRLLAWGVLSSKTKSSDGISVGDLSKTVRSVVPTAERIRNELFASDGSSASGLKHFTGAMALTPVVNPHDFSQQLALPATSNSSNAGAATAAQVQQNGGIDVSPEAQAFVLTLEAAYRDWVQAGSPGQNAAVGRAGVSLAAIITAVSVVVGILL